jgi:hypothetical protein
VPQPEDGVGEDGEEGVTPAEAIAALSTLRSGGFIPRVVPLPQGKWRVEISQPGHGFTTVEPAQPGHDTIEEAVAAVVSRVDGLKAARREAADAEVASFVRSRRLRDTTVDVGGEPQPRWLGQRDDGTWTEPQPSPEEAVQEARRRTAAAESTGAPQR